jgi:hypothetical protein
MFSSYHFLLSGRAVIAPPSFYFLSLVCYGRELQKFFASPLAIPQGLLSYNGSSLELIGRIT